MTIVYLTSITSRNQVEDHILTPLSAPGMIDKNSRTLTWNDLLPVISEKGCRQRHDMNDVFQDLISGRVIIYLSGSNTIYSFFAHTVAKRQPADAQAERSIRAPRITFIEDLDDNLSLIRDGIKDVNLRVEKAVLAKEPKQMSPSSIYTTWLTRK